MSEIRGQISMYDAMAENENRKPCEYRFHRFIGQRIRFWREGIEATISEIKPYYTYCLTDNGEILVGTPYDISPMEEK